MIAVCQGDDQCWFEIESAEDVCCPVASCGCTPKVYNDQPQEDEMDTTEKILNPPSRETEDRVAHAVRAIREAEALIREHYTEVTDWPGWADDAALTVRLASRLLMMSADEGTS